MSDKSPMIDRLRGKLAAHCSLPGRGRLRIGWLAVIVLVFCALIVSLRGHSKTAAARSGVPAAKLAATATASRAAAFDEAETAPCTPSIGAVSDFEKVREFLSKCPPRLTCDKDTIRSGGDAAIACYSLDTVLQKFIGKLLRQYQPRYAAGAVVDPLTGRVIALVSWRQDTVPDLGPRLFLRSLFPAASIFKTVTAAAAIEGAHYTGGTIIPAAGRNHTLYRFQLKKDIDPWQEISLGDAFAKSVNSVFARIGMHVVGKNMLAGYSRRFGFNAAVPFELAVDSSRVDVPDDTTYAMAELSSGFNKKTTISPLHGALIAGAIAADGRMMRPSLVDSVCRGDGRRIYRSEPHLWMTPLSPAAAGELRTMMRQVIDCGTGRKAFQALRACAWSAALDYGGKTGSILVERQGKVDWFIGYAVDRNNPGRRLSVGMVTVHGELWTVHSSFIGAEIFRTFFRPVRGGAHARIAGGSDSTAVSRKTKG